MNEDKILQFLTKVEDFLFDDLEGARYEGAGSLVYYFSEEFAEDRSKLMGELSAIRAEIERPKPA